MSFINDLYVEYQNLLLCRHSRKQTGGYFQILLNTIQNGARIRTADSTGI